MNNAITRGTRAIITSGMRSGALVTVLGPAEGGAKDLVEVAWDVDLNINDTVACYHSIRFCVRAWNLEIIP